MGRRTGKRLRPWVDLTARYGFPVRPDGVTSMEWAVALWRGRGLLRFVEMQRAADEARAAEGKVGAEEMVELARAANLPDHEREEVESEARRAIMREVLSGPKGV